MMKIESELMMEKLGNLLLRYNHIGPATLKWQFPCGLYERHECEPNLIVTFEGREETRSYTINAEKQPFRLKN